LFDGGLCAVGLAVNGADLGAFAREQSRNGAAIAGDFMLRLTRSNNDSLFTSHSIAHRSSYLLSLSWRLFFRQNTFNRAFS
jgi:hypothetical protein